MSEKTSHVQAAQQALSAASYLPTLVVIAKNESRCIERCLRSARPFTARAVVLDTGSCDSTPELARACGAEVHFFDWIDDFAAARNRALDLADAQWSLVLDADEWIEAGSDLGSFVRLADPQIGLVRIQNVDQSSGMDLPVTSWLPRLLPRGVHYEGRIHEQPISKLPRFKSSLVVGHDGYMYDQLKKKRGRNRHLLTQALIEDPEDPYLLYQLGTEHEGAREFALAAELYCQALQRLSAGAVYEHALVVRLIHCLCRAGRVEETLLLMQRFEVKYQHSPDFCFAAGNAYLDIGLHDPAQAMHSWLPQAVHAWKRCLAIGDRPELEGSMRGRGSFLAASNLQVVFSVLGDQEQAAQYKGLAEHLRLESTKST